jgi:hypothetical protein
MKKFLHVVQLDNVVNHEGKMSIFLQLECGQVTEIELTQYTESDFDRITSEINDENDGMNVHLFIVEELGTEESVPAGFFIYFDDSSFKIIESKQELKEALNGHREFWKMELVNN